MWREVYSLHLSKLIVSSDSRTHMLLPDKVTAALLTYVSVGLVLVSGLPGSNSRFSS